MKTKIVVATAEIEIIGVNVRVNRRWEIGKVVKLEGIAFQEISMAL